MPFKLQLNATHITQEILKEDRSRSSFAVNSNKRSTSLVQEQKQRSGFMQEEGTHYLGTKNGRVLLSRYQLLVTSTGIPSKQWHEHFIIEERIRNEIPVAKEKDCAKETRGTQLEKREKRLCGRSRKKNYGKYQAT